MLQVWILPILIVGAMVALSIPIGLYLARIMDGRYQPLPGLGWMERRFDTGPVVARHDDNLRDATLHHGFHDTAHERQSAGLGQKLVLGSKAP